MTASTAADRGRELEQQVAAYFGRHGYAVQTNQVLLGRSGGRHEVDVLAEKSDALTSFQVAVECKAWNSPIEKDVVSKLHYVLTDLGLSKGVIVSLAGARSGADTAASALGIDIWGPDEVRHHLGEAIFAQVAAPAVGRAGNGRLIDAWPFTTDPAHAQQLAEQAGRGRFGLRTLESLAWFAPLWVPSYLVNLTIAQLTTRRMRQQVTSNAVVNLYDAFEGRLLRRGMPAPPEIAAGESVVVKPLRREAQISAALRKAVESRQKVTSAAAVERHDATLASLGIPVPVHSLNVDSTRLVYLPVYAGLLQRTEDRVVAVDAATGRVDEQLGRVLSGQMTHLRNAFA